MQFHIIIHDADWICTISAASPSIFEALPCYFHTNSHTVRAPPRSGQNQAEAELWRRPLHWVSAALLISNQFVRPTPLAVPSTEMSWMAKRRMMVQIIPRVILAFPSTISEWKTKQKLNITSVHRRAANLVCTISHLLSRRTTPTRPRTTAPAAARPAFLSHWKRDHFFHQTESMVLFSREAHVCLEK